MWPLGLCVCVFEFILFFISGRWSSFLMGYSCGNDCLCQRTRTATGEKIVNETVNALACSPSDSYSQRSSDNLFLFSSLSSAHIVWNSKSIDSCEDARDSAFFLSRRKSYFSSRRAISPWHFLPSLCIAYINPHKIALFSFFMPTSASKYD